MKDDILKFRKLCNILIEEKDMSVNKICIESGITWPTMKKLREEDMSTIRIQSSVLGQIQNYIHKHCDTIRLAGIKCDELQETFTEKSEKESKKLFLQGQEDVIMAGKRDLGPVRENESIKLAGTKVHEKIEKQILGKRKYTKKEKVIKETIVVSDKHEEAHEDLSDRIKFGNLSEENNKKLNLDTEVIDSKSLTQIIIFLRMKAMEYRVLAKSFDVSADQLEKTNL